MTVTTHSVCLTCCSALFETNGDRPHECLTDSKSEAALFRLSHHGHDVREAVVHDGPLAEVVGDG